jgi:hypothetical protein
MQPPRRGEPDTSAAAHSEKEEHDLRDPVAGEPRDLLGGAPAETLLVPLPRNPTIGDLDYYARQLLAMIAEDPGNWQRIARIKAANETGIIALKKETTSKAHADTATALYDQVQRALKGARSDG